MSVTPRKAAPRRDATRILEALDVGLPVTAGGLEYVMLDKIYERRPMYDVNGNNVGYRPLGFENISMLAILTGCMTEAEAYDLTATKVLNEHRLNRRHSTIQMLADAKAHLEALKDQPLIAKELVDRGEWIIRPSRIRLGSEVAFAPDNEIKTPGATVEGFAVLATCFREEMGDDNRYEVQIGYCDRHEGFKPDPDLKRVPEPCNDTSPSPDF